MKKSFLLSICIISFCISCKKQAWQTDNTNLALDTVKTEKQIQKSLSTNSKELVKYFKNDLETIIATYSSQNNIPLVKLQSSSKEYETITLKQINQYLNTADFGNDTILWQDKEDRSLLIINGIENEYSRTNE